jgi:hypothetical protein
VAIFRRSKDKDSPASGGKATKRGKPAASTSSDDQITLRVPKGLLKVLGGLGLVALIAAGVWYFALRDTGPSEAELEAQRREEQRAAAQAKAAECESLLGGLLTSLEDLDSRLTGVGVNYQDYLQRVGDVSAAYGQVAIPQLPAECLTNVGIHAEGAMNAYIEAGDTWSDCVGDFGCDIDAIDPELQERWVKASGLVDNARNGLSEVGSP